MNAPTDPSPFADHVITHSHVEVGQRPAGHVNLAALALQQLTRLLESQST